LEDLNLKLFLKSVFYISIFIAVVSFSMIISNAVNSKNTTIEAIKNKTKTAINSNTENQTTEATIEPTKSPSQTIDKNGKIAYITIDDGPSENTLTNLNTLKEKNVKATFFAIYHKDCNDIYKQIINEGHTLGNHTYDHNYSTLYSSNVEEFKTSVEKLHEFYKNEFDYTSTVFRFPGGTMGRSSDILNPRIDILNDLGYKSYDWNSTTADSDETISVDKYGSVENIVNKLTSNILDNAGDRDRLIILMHDSESKIYTVKALPKIIDGLEEIDYQFDTLDNYE
jgi:peptidoglycan/xylan/chitin deacetylase (PgdA/CDA1 family)